MIGNVSAKYALRSLWRHPRRTILSMVGAGVGCAIGIIATAWVGGSADMQLRAISESGAGHLRIVPPGWLLTKENNLRLTDAKSTLEQVKSMSGIGMTVPRARANGLLAFGNRTRGVQIVGVQPKAERKSNRLVYKSKLTGRYLEPGDKGATVIGGTLAKRLDVELDDDLYVTLSGKDGMTSAMFRIVGILHTGSRDLDASICHVTLTDLARVTGHKGIGEVSIMLKDARDLPARQQELRDLLEPRNDVISWKQVSPDLAANVDGDKAFMNILIVIILVVVALGITGAQITAVLERRRELAVLSALGMKGRQIVGVMIVEAVFIGMGGALAGLILGSPYAYWLTVKGVDFSKMMGGETAFGGVLLDPVIYAAYGSWVLWYAPAVSLAACLLASIYPAWFATRTKPAEGLRAGG